MTVTPFHIAVLYFDLLSRQQLLHPTHLLTISTIDMIPDNQTQIATITADADSLNEALSKITSAIMCVIGQVDNDGKARVAV